METKTKENGQAKVVSTVADKKAPQFVAGNPVNKVSENEAKPESKSEALQAPKVESVKVDAPAPKLALNLEQTLQLIGQLAEKTALRNTYNGYIDSLKAFVLSQNDDDMARKDDPSFKGCELIIRDGKGHDFYTSSASVIAGTVVFMTNRFTERLAEVEAEIVIPA